MVSNTVAPTLLSFAFSPFMSTTGVSGALKAVWIAVGCRILIGQRHGLDRLDVLRRDDLRCRGLVCGSAVSLIGCGCGRIRRSVRVICLRVAFC